MWGVEGGGEVGIGSLCLLHGGLLFFMAMYTVGFG